MVTSPTVYWEEQRCCQDLQRLRIFPHLQQVLLSRVLGPLPPVGLVDQQLDVVLVDAHLEHQSTALLPGYFSTDLANIEHSPDVGVKRIHLEIKDAGKTYEIFFLARKRRASQKIDI